MKNQNNQLRLKVSIPVRGGRFSIWTGEAFRRSILKGGAMDQQGGKLLQDMELYIKHHDLFVRVCQLIKKGKLELLKNRLDLIERQA